jgi:hypothetical protein
MSVMRNFSAAISMQEASSSDVSPLTPDAAGGALLTLPDTTQQPAQADTAKPGAHP